MIDPHHIARVAWTEESHFRASRAATPRCRVRLYTSSLRPGLSFCGNKDWGEWTLSI